MSQDIAVKTATDLGFGQKIMTTEEKLAFVSRVASEYEWGGDLSLDNVLVVNGELPEAARKSWESLQLKRELAFVNDIRGGWQSKANAEKLGDDPRRQLVAEDMSGNKLDVWVNESQTGIKPGLSWDPTRRCVGVSRKPIGTAYPAFGRKGNELMEIPGVFFISLTETVKASTALMTLDGWKELQSGAAIAAEARAFAAKQEADLVILNTKLDAEIAVAVAAADAVRGKKITPSKDAILAYLHKSGIKADAESLTI